MIIILVAGKIETNFQHNTSEYEHLSSSGKVVENLRCTSSRNSSLRRKECSRNPAYLVVKKLFR
jgi:hypothetical protein